MAGPGHLLVGGDVGSIIADEVLASGAADYSVTHMKDAAAANVVFVNGVCITR